MKNISVLFHVSSRLVPEDWYLFEKQRRVNVLEEMLSMTNYWQWDLDLCLCPGNSFTFYWISYCRWTISERSTSKQVESKGHVDCCLQLPLRCPQKVSFNWPNRLQRMLFRLFASSSSCVDQFLKTRSKFIVIVSR